ncbi:MAG: hypothetical protein M3437_06925 [Chloroflexota bacterium]|nr:hypothetical protein [Chloroflexota bacterium]MDQ5865886.1 hypothetical protein [Chloroflexota bacterium]
MLDKAVVDIAMRAALSEYQALKSEIQYRSEYQNRYLGLHITALTTIMGVTVTQLDNPHIHWLIFLIPFESVLFGFLYTDHTEIIHRLAKYLRRIELQVNHLVRTPELMSWEVDLRSHMPDWPRGFWFWRVSKKAEKEDSPPGNTIHELYSRHFFAIPGVAALVVVAFWFALGLPWFGVSFNFRLYTERETWIAATLFLIEAVSLLGYLVYTASIRDLDKRVSDMIRSSAFCEFFNDLACTQAVTAFFFGRAGYFTELDIALAVKSEVSDDDDVKDTSDGGRTGSGSTS